MKKPFIGIVGIGFVGGAVKHWFEREGYPLVCYGKNEKVGSMEEINKADIMFVCVPTPYHETNGGFDGSIVRETVANIAPGKIIVIKSTILPGTTESLQKEFTDRIILFNPEFLVAKTAKEDFFTPNRQIIGYTEQSKKYAKQVLAILPRAPHETIMPSTQAEMVKYFDNSFLALRVIFANQIYDLCQALDINYDTVKEWAGYDPRVGHSHFDVNHDGYRGYDGACLPKDTKSLIALAESLNVPFSLLKESDRINEQLKKDSHI